MVTGQESSTASRSGSDLQQIDFPETRQRLGEILLREGMVDSRTLDAALRLQAA